MKLSSIRINGKAIEEGGWVGDVPNLPGVRLKVRGLGNTDFRRLQAKLQRDIPRERRLDGFIDPKDADEIEARCLAETILVDWQGIEADNGEPMAFSQNQALGLLSDPDFLVFRNAVVYAATMVAATKAEDAERDAGN